MSGVSRMPGKHVRVNSPPRVRIPPLPPLSPMTGQAIHALAHQRIHHSENAPCRGGVMRTWPGGAALHPPADCRFRRASGHDSRNLAAVKGSLHGPVGQQHCPHEPHATTRLVLAPCLLALACITAGTAGRPKSADAACRSSRGHYQRQRRPAARPVQQARQQRGWCRRAVAGVVASIGAI